MKHIIKLSALAGFASLAMMATPAMADDNPEIAAAVMAMAQAQWDAEIAGKPVADQIVTIADDYTEFNPGSPIRIDGKALNARYYKAAAMDGSKPIASEMINPKVQVYGDTAILTYNFVGMIQSKDGKILPNNALSTRVYSRINGKWMLVHGHFTAAK